MSPENMKFDYKFKSEKKTEPDTSQNDQSKLDEPVEEVAPFQAADQEQPASKKFSRPEKKATKTQSEQSQAVKKRFNLWKYAFLLLVAFLLALAGVTAYRVSSLREADYQPTTTIAAGEPVFQVTATKAQVNKIIDYYLTEFLGTSGIQYKFYLENQAMLNGTFEILGHSLNFYFYFDPYVMEDGNVQLKAKSLSIGSLDLPMSELFKYIAKNYKLPEWVAVDSENKTILLNLNQFKLKNGMYLRADKINLVDDEIKVNVYLPEDVNQSAGTKETNNSTTTTEKE